MSSIRMRGLSFIGMRSEPGPDEVEIRNSELFDEAWYLEQYQDVVDFRAGAIAHYLEFGWKEARSPSPLFDTNWYLTAYDDVRRAKINPLLHYIRRGAMELRDTGPLFRPSLLQDPEAPRGIEYLAAATARLRGMNPRPGPSSGALSAERPRLLIIAELTIPQCRKYRVDQKVEMARLLGFDCDVCNWHDPDRCEALLAEHRTAIFYRVPAYPHMLAMIERARANGVQTFWEVDDLIFDVDEYARNSNLRTLPPATQQVVLDGVPLYRAAMLACDAGIASTPALADLMRRAGVPQVHVIENALDSETIAFAADAVTRPRPDDGLVRIVYGSGTKTHDIDFLEAAPAILECMRARPTVVLRIIGELSLPDTFAEVMDRVEIFDAVAYEAYLKLMAECDIAIAPLEPSAFSDAKSNIKYIEASVVNLPSVCSRSSAFESVIHTGENGFLAGSTAEWFESLHRLAEQAPVRASVAAKAKALVGERYAPRSVAAQQLAPLLQRILVEGVFRGGPPLT